ncbi:bifunctional DNA primase/polymerase [Shimia thalassica]|uniref:bifunctional DNA primase/polymerase n=1 Tax=Shimia thalassica TaxID=1715693 RepID=UPI0026E1AE01|nr:bifunctional DNA primase/polymerase [Shimia thalassica]MDO6479130.1 bifunctional DNA primase/polymerase [Shimia thalassica]
MQQDRQNDLSGQAAAFNNIWRDEAEALGLPAFPVRISWDDTARKWTKRPLTPNGLHDATTDLDALDWSNANGFGIRTGCGVYALDIDDPARTSPPAEWVRRWNVPTGTRIHKTVSGGFHLIYTLPEQYQDLPTRQNIVPGLDARGKGGFIAFGQGYELYDDSDPIELPEAVCREITAGYGGSMKMVGRTAPALPQGTGEAVMRRFERYRQTNITLRDRWAGDMGTKIGDNGHDDRDRSASGLDFSIARLLAMGGFTYDEICHVLRKFPFGKYNNSATPLPLPAAERQVQRAANKAVTAAEEERRVMAGKLLNAEPEINEDEIAAAVARLTS